MKEKQKIAKIALFRTFKTQKELIDYFNMHTPEERRLLYNKPKSPKVLHWHVFNLSS